MGSERTHVDKYLCTVCGHRHSNGWYCKHSIDAKDAEIERLKAQLSASEEKRKVLGEALEELVTVAGLRGDNDLPHPANDPKLWTARMQQAWDDAAKALEGA